MKKLKGSSKERPKKAPQTGVKKTQGKLVQTNQTNPTKTALLGPTTTFSLSESPKPPLVAPRAWRPLFTVSTPWIWFRLTKPSGLEGIEGLTPEVIEQVSEECANWLIFPGLTELRTDLTALDQISKDASKRIEKLAEHIEVIRESLKIPPEEGSSPSPAPEPPPVPNADGNEDTPREPDLAESPPTPTEESPPSSTPTEESPPSVPPFFGQFYADPRRIIEGMTIFILKPPESKGGDNGEDGEGGGEGESESEGEEESESPNGKGDKAGESQTEGDAESDETPQAEGEGKGKTDAENEGDAEGEEGTAEGGDGEGSENASGADGGTSGSASEGSAEGDDEGDAKEDSSEEDDTLPEPLKAAPPPPEKELKARETLSKLLPSQRNYGTGGQDPTVDPQKLQKLADRFGNDRRWAKFLDMIGRISSDAWAPPAKTITKARDDVKDLELGDDISRLISSELLRFGVPEMAGSAYIDFVEKRLMQMAMEGSESMGKGPIMVAVDFSYSMNDTSPISIRNEGSNLLDLALALTMGLVRISDVQKRPVLVVGYNEGLTFSKTVRCSKDAVDMMLFLSDGHRPMGGTAFDPPLRAMAAEAMRFQGGDMLMITDGEGPLSPKVQEEINAIRKSKGVRVFTLLLCAEGSQERPAFSHTLHAVSDFTIPLRGQKDLEDLGSKIAEGASQTETPPVEKKKRRA